MKKKKALLALMMAAMVIAVGGLATIALQYFSQTAASSNAGGDLSIDYYVSEEEETAAADTQQSSKNVFQWLMDQLAADKEKADVAISAEVVSGEQTTSGVSQNRRETVEDDEDVEETAPVEDLLTEAKKNDKDNKNKETEEDEQVKEEETQDTTEKDAQQEKPNEQEQQKQDQRLVTISIRCDTAVAKGMNLESKWAGIVPSSGTILQTTSMEFQEGDTVFDVLCRVRDTYKIQVEYSGTNGAQYIEGINNLYEFDGGRWSGWMYCVNDWYPNYGCGQYAVKNGDVIEWNYTCNLGRDLGQDWMASDEWMEANE